MIRKSSIITLTLAMWLTLALSGCGNRLSLYQSTLPDDVKAAPEQAAVTEADPGFYYNNGAELRLRPLEKQLKQDFGPEAESAYYCYNFVDLNEDQNNEILVWFHSVSPAAQGSSKLLIYSSDYVLNYEMTGFTPPVVVLKETHGDWADLALFIGKGKYQKLIYSDNGYQLSDKSKENVIEYSQIQGQAYLSDANKQKGFQIE